jgi:exopolysaccharide production protein ExoZ
MKDARTHKFLGLQALRLVAALLVVCTHATFYASERLDKHFATWERGTRGVDIFFVISGFVMVYSSQKLFASPGGWRKFAQHRIIRIVPLYWLVTTLKVLSLLLTTGLVFHATLRPIPVICSYLFLPSRNPDGNVLPLVNAGWTLNFEMLFYFFFAAALFLRANVFKFVGFAMVLLSIAAYFRTPAWPPIAFYLNSVVLEFYLGMLTAKACLQGIYFPKRLAYLLMGCGLILLLLPPLEWGPKFLISGVPASLIVWSAASLGKLEELIPRFVLYLGDASYAIYLIHPFVCPLAPTVMSHLHMNHPWPCVVVSAALGLGVGCVLHQFIELPMTNWLKASLGTRHSTRILLPVR